jgi:hypothetical protein
MIFLLMVIVVLLLGRSVRVLIVWGLLMLTTFIFLFMLDRKKISITYFMIQELLNYLFLLSSSSILSSILLRTKMGLRPVYVWVMLIIKDLSKMELTWLLTVSKAPTGVLLIKLISSTIFTFLVFGLVVTSFIMLLVSDRKGLIMLRSRSTTTMPILFVVKFYYLLLVYFLLFYWLFSERAWERVAVSRLLVLVLISLPILPIFLLKIMFITNNITSLLLLLVFLVSTSMITFSYLYLLILLVNTLGKKILSRLCLRLLLLLIILS